MLPEYAGTELGKTDSVRVEIRMESEQHQKDICKYTSLQLSG